MNNKNDWLIALAALFGQGAGYVIKNVLLLIFGLIMLWAMSQILPHIFAPEPDWHNWGHVYGR